MLSWLICIPLGVGLGLMIAILSKKDSTKDATEFFTDDSYLERNVHDLYQKWKER